MSSNNFNEVVKKIAKHYIIDINFIDPMYFIKTDYSSIKKLAIFLKLHTICRFTILYDLSVFINPYSTVNKNKFSIYYYLSSIQHNAKVIVGVQLKNETSVIDSFFNLFKSSIWLEREVWDMFGVFFEGNEDLRRILTDYGFRYNPLLKEFPLKGYYELKYYDSSAILQYVKVKDQQQAKIFDFKNPWKFF